MCDRGCIRERVWGRVGERVCDRRCVRKGFESGD